MFVVTTLTKLVFAVLDLSFLAHPKYLATEKPSKKRGFS